MELSELRKDIVSGDWIVIAKGRKARPHDLHTERKRIPAAIHTCPFEEWNEEPILEYRKGNDWTVRVVPNKFPAFTHPGVCSEPMSRGIYTVAGGVGHHDLVITRGHTVEFPDLPRDEAVKVFEAYRDRYRQLLNDDCLAYVSMFHNWGASAGASVYHPHYQMITIPVIPPDVMHSLNGSARYFTLHERCVHCDIIAWEKKEGTRVVFENEYAIALAPFVSRQAFEFRIFPKDHVASFEDSVDGATEGIVEVVQEGLRRMRSALGDPDYNFFIHTSPLKDKEQYRHYHWHIEVLPKLNVMAGFELGTGIEINPVDPDEAAEILRGSNR